MSVELRAVTKGFGDRAPLLDEVDLQVANGELLVVTGASGSGKTTLLSIMAALSLPSKGEVLIDGEEVTRLRDRHRTERRRASVASVFQQMALVPSMRVADNLTLPYLPMGGPDEQVTKTIHELATRLGIQELLGERTSVLSGGERQRVALVRAFAMGAANLMLDEPTAHLDDLRCSDVMALIRERCHGGASAVLVSHDERVMAGARVVRLERGELEELTIT